MGVREYRNGSRVIFDSAGRQISSIDLTGKEFQFFYDGVGRLVEQRDPLGGAIQYLYSGERLDRIIDPQLRETSFVYQDGKLSEVHFPDNTIRKFEYDDNGLLTAEFDQRENARYYQYNDWQRVEKVIRADGTEVVVNDAASMTAANGHAGGEVGELQIQGEEEGEVANSVTDAREIETVMLEDENGYISTIINGAGERTSIEYDLDGRPVKITRDDGTYSTMNYDQKTGDLLSSYDSASGANLSITYDERGNVLTKTNARGELSVKYGYSADGLLIKEEYPLSGQIVNYIYNEQKLVSQKEVNGQVVSFLYDEFGNLIKTTDSLGATQNLVRNETGLVTSIIDAKGNEAKRDYSVLGQLTAVTSANNETTSYQYSPTGKLEKIIDPLGKETIFEYNQLDQLERKTDQLGNITQLFYDGNGNVVREIDPNANEKNFEYNAKDQLIKKTLPDNIYQLAYDTRGNVIQLSSNNSQIDLSYESMPDGDVVKTVDESGTDLPNLAIEYSYNIAGSRVAMVANGNNFSYQYDSAERLIRLTNHKNESFNFDYDLQNRLKRITRPGGESSFEFDSTNFLTKILHKDNSSNVISFFDYSRDILGNRKQIRTPSSTQDFSYDLNNQLTAASNTEVMGDFANESFIYDSLGNRTSDQLGNYLYDQTKQRLVEDYQYLYAFDNNGNLTSRQSKVMGSEVTNFIYNSENQLIKVELYDGATLLKEVSYSYNALGKRVTKEITDHQVPANSFTRKYQYDGDELLFEYNDTNDLLATYTQSTMRTDDTLAVDVTAAGVMASVAKQSQSYFFIKDGLGSIVEVANSSGSKVQHHVYSAFGKLLKIEDGNGVEVTDAPEVAVFFAFTGRELDSETGLYFYRARYYSPELGRFLTTDQNPGRIKNPITYINKYIYAGNNPIMHSDPFGQSFLGLSSDTWTDIGFASVAFMAIVLSGGTAAAALYAIGSAAIGSYAVAGAMSYGQTGSFTQNLGKNFHTPFRITMAFLTVSAIASGISAGTGVWGSNPSSDFYAGGTGTQGYVGSNSGNAYARGPGFAGSGTGAWVGGPNPPILHEWGHSLQFIGTAYLAGRMDRKVQGSGSRWVNMYGLYYASSAPGAACGFAFGMESWCAY